MDSISSNRDEWCQELEDERMISNSKHCRSLVVTNRDGRRCVEKRYSLEFLEEKNIHLEDLNRMVGLLKELRHPNIIRVRESFHNTMYWILVKEFSKAKTLEQLICEENDLSRKNVMVLADQLTSALKYLHKMGTPHGNLKPSNVLVAEDCHLHVCDMQLSSELCPPEASMVYCSPERFQDGKASFHDDVWAMGCVYLEMILLEVCKESFWKVVNGQVELRDNLLGKIYLFSSCFGLIIKRLLSVDVHLRPTTEQVETLLSVYNNVEEPYQLCCPIMGVMYRDPVFVPGSGNTYERSAIQSFWRNRTPGTRPRDPLTNIDLPTETVYVNWDKRREVAAWLAEHADYVPYGWSSRCDVPPVESRLGDALAGTAHLQPGGVLGYNLLWLADVLVQNSSILFLLLATVFYALGLHELSQYDWMNCPNDKSMAESSAVMEYPVPKGSRLQILEVSSCSEHQLSVKVPAANLFDFHFDRFGISLIILGVVWLWTRTACKVNAPLPFIMCSAPFWLVGSHLFRDSLRPLYEDIDLKVGPGILEISSTLFGLACRTRAMQLRDVQAVRQSSGMQRNDELLSELEIHQGARVHRWGTVLSSLEVHYVKKVVGEYIIRQEEELRDGCSRQQAGGGGCRWWLQTNEELMRQFAEGREQASYERM
ncbi:hypothetical protein GUITHDRAFT_161944 [Guillardia theta CCMP2712]|uniref:non-specific serine/threonine protein kinase n=1 Tax=Guillardia theta (strain CCMP2712) TaxID=905079 RepID=L1JNI3_GUITC|nr:hypothetical protein GUITHDRAFT_161944 [Guillardia theta CCMP2712]EKX49814.1 hypothetical protein GUITHDRAFT_161944 [Guillardia theta CCMP2712]|eukprot:XP_005836794.1 hypothetical protein GUITHDRAFT_161944 [Guillardia theta CCMP2712]